MWGFIDYYPFPLFGYISIPSLHTAGLNQVITIHHFLSGYVWIQDTFMQAHVTGIL